MIYIAPGHWDSSAYHVFYITDHPVNTVEQMLEADPSGLEFTVRYHGFFMALYIEHTQLIEEYKSFVAVAFGGSYEGIHFRTAA